MPRKERIHLFTNCARDVDVWSLIQCCRPVVGVKEIDAKAGNRECSRFAAPRRTGYDEHPRRHLPAEIAIRAFPHVAGKIRADTLALAISYAEPLQFFRRGLGSLRSGLQVGISLWPLQLRTVENRHSTLIILP
jgi:hypothetical protein